MLFGFELDDMTASLALGGMSLAEQRRLLDAYKQVAGKLRAIDHLYDSLEGRRAGGALQGLRERARGSAA
jgi:hypothetical protein